jgi:hypothetical protein
VKRRSESGLQGVVLNICRLFGRMGGGGGVCVWSSGGERNFESFSPPKKSSQLF